MERKAPNGLEASRVLESFIYVRVAESTVLEEYDVSDLYINPRGKRLKLLANAQKLASLIAHTEGFYIGKRKDDQYEIPENGIHSRSVDDDM
ncbi:hypothetical protein TorRG33x02_278830 [Trema orientale]|uniref:Uncharacterized protein n=1 Tax=Trema orientale TaxID=63057 RepID=A0A2P5CNC7_TREOI|nr:hypothetical protein TorRG33x02_278830 [Trema orientale]